MSEITKFKEKYEEFSRRLLKDISRKYQEAGSKKIIEKNYQFYGDDWNVDPVLVDEYERYIPRYDDEIFQSVEAINCAKAFFSAGLSAEIKLSDKDGVTITNPNFERLSFAIKLELIHPIRYFARNYKTTRFNSQRMDKCLDHYIKIWLGKGNSEPRYAPIYNFESDVQSIKLDNFVSIVRFTDKQKTKIFNAIGLLRKDFDIQGYCETSHVVVLKPINSSFNKEEKKEIGKHARKALQAAITSLRLIRSEMVGTTGFMHVARFIRTSRAGISPLESYSVPLQSIFRARYRLDRKDLPSFRQVYRMLSVDQFAAWNGLTMPLRQFNRSCQREREEDKILDYAICLESTLLRGVDRELSYRLSLRAAKLLHSVRDPQETFAMFRCLYDIRSKIVHSNETWGGPAITKLTKAVGETPSEYMGSLDRVMRQLLKEIVRQVHEGRSLNALCRKLDTEILGSSPNRFH